MRSPARFCSGMEWDWGNPSLFGRKDAKASGAFSASEVGNGSSRSSISASVDSSSKIGGSRVSGFSSEGFSKKVNKITELARPEDTGTSPIAVEFGEPLIGLKLGKRTYLEDDCAGNTVEGLSTTLVSSVPSSVVGKKKRSSSQIEQSSHCQVEGCDIDLSGAKDYHRKHRVCLTHSKSPKVVVAGQERRFCQQCSRFHDLSEFDQKKRSCRRRLSDHNARRRKPQTDTISFNLSMPYSSFYDEQQMNFILDRAPFGHGRPTASSTWGSSCGFSLTHTKGSSVKSAKAGGVDGHLDFSNSPLSDTVAPLPHDLDKLLRFKGTTTELLSQGPEASVISSENGAPDLQRALSLLSTGCWGSCNPTQTNLAKFVNSSHSSAAHPTVQAVDSMPGFWHYEQPSSEQVRVLPLDLHSNGGQYQEFQLFKAPYDTTFFDSSQTHPKPDGQFLEFKA